MKREIDEGCGGFRTTLAELVSDPLIGLMMKSDGVDPRTIELLFERLSGERARASLSVGIIAEGQGGYCKY